MSVAVACVALAAVLWPDGVRLRRARLGVRGERRVRAATGSRRRWPTAGTGTGDRARVAPPTVAAAAVLVAAVVSTPLVAVLAGGGAALAARSWVARSARDDADRRLAALTEALGVLAAELRSGRHLDAAVATTVDGCTDADLGRALAGALRAPGLARPDPDGGGPVTAALDRVSAAVLLSRRTGCSLSAVVGAVEDDLRARTRHLQELRSALAGPRASAALLAALPLLGLAMGSGIGADPWHVLTTTGTGQVLLVAGVGLEVAGLVWSRRLVRRAIR